MSVASRCRTPCTHIAQFALPQCISFNYRQNCVWMSHFRQVLIVLVYILIALYTHVCVCVCARDYHGAIISNRKLNATAFWRRSHDGVYDLPLCCALAFSLLLFNAFTVVGLLTFIYASRGLNDK